MFEKFVRSESSWGNLAHVDDAVIAEGLRALGSVKTLGAMNSKGSKGFQVQQTETITITRKSKPKKVTARGIDAAHDLVRTMDFEYDYDPLFDDVNNLILASGKKPDIRRSNQVRKSV